MKHKAELTIECDLNTAPSTFLLRWNPAISSYTMERLDNDIEFYASQFSPYNEEWAEEDDFDWSVYEWKKAQKGDRFFMVRVGEGKTGIFAAGYFTSDPYKSDDWSGKGREVYYMRMGFEAIFHPERTDIITIEELQRELPDINWEKGHSGELLTPNDAARLEQIWEEHLEKHMDDFKPRAVLNKSYYID